MRKLSFIFLFISLTLSSQKIKITDAETGKPIANARIISQTLALYSNDDGLVEFTGSDQSFEVSAGGYRKEKVVRFQNVIALQPLVRDIEEVKIISIDVQPIFQDLIKNYHKRYYSKPSVYDVVVRSKNYENDKLNSMSIAEAKIWMKSNMFNYRDAQKNEYEKMYQTQLNKIKYLKKGTVDSAFSAQTDEFKRDAAGAYFFNYELNRLLANIKAGKYLGKLLADEDGEQTIGFKTQSQSGVKLDGMFKYNKADKVITYIETHYDMEDMAVKKMTAKDGRTFDFKYGVATKIFDFYKKDGYYIPGMLRQLGDRYVIFYKDKALTKKSAYEVYFNTFAHSTNAGLDKKADPSKGLLSNAEVKDSKEAVVLLSEEEQNFINQN